MEVLSSTGEAGLAAESGREIGESGDVVFRAYLDETDLPFIMNLVDKELSEPYSIFTYRYFIHQWPELCYLAFVGTKCVGTIVCKMDEHKSGHLRGYIAMLVVLKNYRGRKVATELVDRCITVMLEAGCPEVVLEAEVTNASALALYGNLGFIYAKLLHRYYLNGADAYRLKLRFPQPDDEEDVDLPTHDSTDVHGHEGHMHGHGYGYEERDGGGSSHVHVHGEQCDHNHNHNHDHDAHRQHGHAATSDHHTNHHGGQVPVHVHGPSCRHGPGHGQATATRQQPVHVHGPSCDHGHGEGGSKSKQEAVHVHGPSCRHGNGNNVQVRSQNEGRQESGHVHGPSCRHGSGEGGSAASQGEERGATSERSGKKKGQKKKGGNKHRG